MWTARRIVSLALLMVAVFVGSASAQYNAPAAPPAPSAPSAPSTPSAPSSAPPSTGVPDSAAMYPFTVNVAFATVGAGEKVILTDAQGMPLYYLRNETSTATRCIGTCAAVWPPALAPDAATFDPALNPLTVVDTTNGRQMAYHGHLLYRFSKDMTPGQVNGDGVIDRWGTWAVATPDLYYQP